MQLLIENNADINIADRSGTTPLHYAISKANIDIIKLLLEARAETNTVAGRGSFTPLHSFLKEDYVDLEVMKLLLNAGAYVKNIENFEIQLWGIPNKAKRARIKLIDNFILELEDNFKFDLQIFNLPLDVIGLIIEYTQIYDLKKLDETLKKKLKY